MPLSSSKTISQKQRTKRTIKSSAPEKLQHNLNSPRIIHIIYFEFLFVFLFVFFFFWFSRLLSSYFRWDIIMSIFYPSDTRRFVHLYIGLFLCGSLSGQWLQDNWRRWCPTRADCVALCGTSLSPSLLCSIGTQQQQCIRASLLPHIPIDSLLLSPCSSLLSHLSLYPPKRLIFINRSRESQQKERRWLKGNISFLTYARLLIVSSPTFVFFYIFLFFLVRVRCTGSCSIRPGRAIVHRAKMSTTTP